MLLRYSGDKGPLCPNLIEPIHPMHKFHVNLIDAAYRAGNVDTETLEFATPEAEKLYAAVAHQEFDGYMLAYKDTSVVMLSGRPEWLETYYYRCSICGLVLPANKVQHA